MASNSAIEWTDATWNPIVGCSIVSPGCTNCYAMRMAARLQRMGMPHYASLTQDSKAGAVWTGEVALAPDHILRAPLGWKKPKRIFVNSMGDLFHESIPDEWIDKVFAVMALCPQHTFQCLTKRAERMLAYCSTIQKNGRWLAMEDIALSLGYEPRGRHDHGFDWLSHKEFLPNVWLGVSTERQQEADERIPLLLQTPAAVRFVSAEPLLGPIDLTCLRFMDEDAEIRLNALTAEAWVENSDSAAAYTNDADGNTKLDWIIVGGESGPDARPMHPDWARSLRDQCAASNVPYFFKQHGEYIGVPDLRYLPGGSGPGFGGYDHCRYDQEHEAVRVGKKRAGRLLDGREHNAMPGRK